MRRKEPSLARPAAAPLAQRLQRLALDLAGVGHGDLGRLWTVARGAAILIVHALLRSNVHAVDQAASVS